MNATAVIETAMVATSETALQREVDVGSTKKDKTELGVYFK